MSLVDFKKQKLISLTRISPSRYLSLQQCPLKEIWASSRQPLLPCNPAAYLGTIIHNLLELAFRGRISNREKLSERWEKEIERLEEEMLKNPVEKHLVPLRLSVLNFEVKKLLAFKMICSLFNGIPHSKDSGSKTSAEDWVQSPDGKVVGRIDLVKKSELGVEIIDYKTGSLTDGSSSSRVKEEYLIQMKMYAALYHSMYGEWPMTLTLIGINQESFSLPVDSEECSGLLQQAGKTMDDVNELITVGLKPEDFAQPSPKACKYCLFRPACSKYWKVRKEDGEWPCDARGRITDKTELANKHLRVVIATDSGEIAIRGLSPDRYPFLKDDVERAIFCNLWNERLEGLFIENMFTTGY